jgi:hypothetical protein
VSDIKTLANQYFPQGYPETSEQWLDFAEHVEAEARAQEREAAKGLVEGLEEISRRIPNYGYKGVGTVARQTLATYNDNRKG